MKSGVSKSSDAPFGAMIVVNSTFKNKYTPKYKKMNNPEKAEVKKKRDDKKQQRYYQGHQHNETRRTSVPSQKFKGATEEFNQSDLFVTTTKKLANYAGRTCKEPQDICIAIEELKYTTFTLPTK